MNEKHITSLSLSKKLKEVKYPQEGEFWWVIDYPDKNYSLVDRDTAFGNGKLEKRDIVAPLASELMERLQGYSICVYWANLKSQYGCGRMFDNENPKILDCQFADTLPNVIAKTYIYLAENGLLKGE